MAAAPLPLLAALALLALPALPAVSAGALGRLCRENEFHCDGRCFSTTSQCDGVRQCLDNNADEDFAECEKATHPLLPGSNVTVRLRHDGEGSFVLISLCNWNGCDLMRVMGSSSSGFLCYTYEGSCNAMGYFCNSELARVCPVGARNFRRDELLVFAVQHWRAHVSVGLLGQPAVTVKPGRSIVWLRTRQSHWHGGNDVGFSHSYSTHPPTIASPPTASLPSTKLPPATSSLGPTKVSPASSSLGPTKLPPGTSSLSPTKLPPATSSLSTTKLPPATSSLGPTKLPPGTSSLGLTKLPPATSSLGPTKVSPATSSLGTAKLTPATSRPPPTEALVSAGVLPARAARSSGNIARMTFSHTLLLLVLQIKIFVFFLRR